MTKSEAQLQLLERQGLRLSKIPFHFPSNPSFSGEESNMHKSFSNKSKQDFDATVEKFKKQIESSGVDLARVMLDVGKMAEQQKVFVETSSAQISKLEENFTKSDHTLTEEAAKSEKMFKELNENLSERRREIGALQVCFPIEPLEPLGPFEPFEPICFQFFSFLFPRCSII